MPSSDLLSSSIVRRPRTRFARLARLAALAMIVVSLVPGAAQAQAPTAPQATVVFARSAAFLPAPVGAYVAINLAPDDAQRANLTSLWDYYMRYPEVRDNLMPELDSMVPGMTWDQLRTGIGSWIGGEAFIAVPNPSDSQMLMQMADSYGPYTSIAGPPPILAGFAVRDLAALVGFLASLPHTSGAGGEDEALTITTTLRNGITVMTYTKGADSYYIAMPQGFVLFSPNQDVLFAALDRQPPTSLAASPSFQEALRASQQAPLMLAYADTPSGSILPSMTPFGSAVPNPSPNIGWWSSSLTFNGRYLRFEQTTAMDASRATQAQRALMSAPPDPLHAVDIVPIDSSVVVGLSHMDLDWAVILEALQTSPGMGSSVEEGLSEFQLDTGLDLNSDVFGWMTGELAFFVSNGNADAPEGLGGGLLIEASDPGAAQTRLRTFIAAIRVLAPPDVASDAVDLGGVTFARFTSGDGTSIYLGTSGRWLIFADDADIAGGMAVRAGSTTPSGGLTTDPGFASMRAALPNQTQGMVFLDIGRLTETILRLGSPSASDAADTRYFVAPFKRMGVAGANTPDRSRSTLLIEIDVPK